ncbi:MAG: iron export ABC transporter permease subunit FetB [Gemmatales bacterium]|nr:MAG: iron export ABC transporter permease subunit FetB [Gemmatales bacterium]
MTTGYVQLTFFQVAIAASLILINGLLSVLLQLRLEWSLLLAALRTVVQLLLIGSILEWVFAADRWYLILAVLAVMTLVAGITAAGRSQHRFPGIYCNSIVSVWASSWLIGSMALFIVAGQFDHWYHPQYSVPLLGMILGNTLNGIALGLNQLGESLISRQARVELALTLGATRWEAAREVVQHAVRTGMIPIINSMMVVGIVNLPGMMTGQILAGAAPLDAVKYQIVIMFFIASATALGTVGVVLLSYRRLFNDRHQFLHWLLRN